MRQPSEPGPPSSNGAAKHLAAPRRGRRRLVVWIVLGLSATTLVALVADGAYSASTVSREVRSATDALERAAEEIRDGRIDQARSSFQEARAAAERASAASERPASRLAALLPWIGDDVDAVRALTEATEIAATAGERLADAAAEAGWDGTSIPGYAPGRIDPAIIAAAIPSLEEATALLAQAEALVEPLDPSGKLGGIAEGIRTAKAQLSERSHQAERAALVARTLPWFLGADGPRTFAIVMMTPADPRGSGGFPGSYGVLHVDDGRFELEELAPTAPLGAVGRVDAPTDVAKRYGRFGGLTHFISSTYSPDWPTAARVWTAMWEESGREPLDGVIGADSVWMSYVLGAIGPVDTSVWPETITADNVSQIVDADTQRTLDHDESDAWQAGIATALWEAVVTRPLPPEAFGNALSRATAERHLQLYAADPEQQALLDELGAAGRAEVPEQPLMVSWSGIVGGRTGYFAEKTIDQQIVVESDGTTYVTLTIELFNPAPADPPSILLGYAKGVPVGRYAAAVSVYLPADAAKVTSRVDGGIPPVSAVQSEFDRDVLFMVMIADSGQTTTAEVRYRTSAPPNGFEVGIVPQPELRPTQVTLDMFFPVGVTVTEVSPEASTDGLTLHYEGAPTVPLAVWAHTDG